MAVARSFPAQNGATRDVEAELARQRAEKRRAAGSLSPVHFTKDLLLGDDWHCMFLNRLCSGVSMLPFEDPPESVLDLGCGSGLWAIEAAKAWPDTKIIGFDRREVQPDLTQSNLGIEYRDLSRRVVWVHGNFLDPLPFDSNHFDFIRICCIGLEVPEDSWQELLEEVSRVLKPGGALEVYEEDPLFPAGKSLRHDYDRTSSLRVPNERVRADSTASAYTTATTHTTRTQSSVTSSSNLNITTEHNTNSASLDSYLSSSSASDSLDSMYVQDHSRLKRAWEKMLDQHFLTHKLTTVLPLYLTSFFKNVQVHPTAYVLLPPPSSERDYSTPTELNRDTPDDADEGLQHWVSEMRSGMVRLDGDPAHRKSATAALRARPSISSITMWNTLHLTRQMRIISSCKEAIWQAYLTLAIGSDGSVGSQPSEPLRDEFERDWSLWEADMKDRIGIRNYAKDAFLGKDADAFSERSASVYRSSKSMGGSGHSDPDKSASLCRALRGFVAWKQAAS